MHIFSGLFSNRYCLLHHWCSFDKYFIELVCRDASWETGDAFADLHSPYSHCDAKRCTCPNGRDHNETSGYGYLNIMWLIRAFLKIGHPKRAKDACPNKQFISQHMKKKQFSLKDGRRQDAPTPILA